jgi:hypothetical protein
MTEETKRALEQATEALTAARAKATEEKKACLAQIAADLPARAEEVAKAMAISQSGNTTALGKERVSLMRAELRKAAEALAGQFVADINDINWPVGTSRSVRPGDVGTALYNHFYTAAAALNGVVRERGYVIDGPAFTPYALFDDSSFGPLASALTTLGQAREQAKRAKADDDTSDAKDIWGE